MLSSLNLKRHVSTRESRVHGCKLLVVVVVFGGCLNSLFRGWSYARHCHSLLPFPFFTGVLNLGTTVEIETLCNSSISFYYAMKLFSEF